MNDVEAVDAAAVAETDMADGPDVVDPTSLLGDGTSSWAIALPPAWWTIPLADEAVRRRSIDGLVERQFGHADASSVLKRRMREAVLEVAEHAVEAGGHLMAVSLMLAAGLPLSATLITYRRAETDLAGEGVRALESRLRTGSPDSTLDLGEVPAGFALRKISRRSGPADLGAGDVEQLLVEYWVEPAAGGPLLSLVFTTPHLELATAMTELFDAIVAGVTVVEG